MTSTFAAGPRLQHGRVSYRERGVQAHTAHGREKQGLERYCSSRVSRTGTDGIGGLTHACRINCGTWVVLPEPVSPVTMVTTLPPLSTFEQTWRTISSRWEAIGSTALLRASEVARHDELQAALNRS